MFREKYKNANRHIDSADAYKRIQEKLQESKKPKISWKQVASMVACFVIAVVGVSVYEISKPEGGDVVPQIEPQMARMADVENIEIAIGEPLFDMIPVDEKELEKIINDNTYKKTTLNGADVFEKNTGDEYECWIEKDGKVTKITARGITDEERDEIINSILQ